jgi:hypothetical protein
MIAGVISGRISFLTCLKMSRHVNVCKSNSRTQGGLTMANKCGDCVFLEKEDGFPYCVTLPLYTERDPDDAACEYFVDRRADDEASE